MDNQKKFQDLLQELQLLIKDRRWGDYMHDERQHNLFKEISSKFQMFRHSQDNIMKTIDQVIKTVRDDQNTLQSLYPSISSLETTIAALSSQIHNMDSQFSIFLTDFKNLKHEIYVQKSKKRVICDDSDDSDSSDSDNSIISSVSNLGHEFSYNTNDEVINVSNTPHKKEDNEDQSLVTPEKGLLCGNSLSSDESIDSLGTTNFSNYVKQPKKRNSLIKFKKENTAKVSSIQKCVIKNPYKKKRKKKLNKQHSIYFLPFNSIT